MKSNFYLKCKIPLPMGPCKASQTTGDGLNVRMVKLDIKLLVGKLNNFKLKIGKFGSKFCLKSSYSLNSGMSRVWSGNEGGKASRIGNGYTTRIGNNLYNENWKFFSCFGVFFNINKVDLMSFEVKRGF